MKRSLTGMIFGIGLLSLTGCAGPHGHQYGYNNGNYRNTLTGAAIGAAGGALVGHAVEGDGSGALVGGALGAMAGGGIGYHMDRKRQAEAYAPRYDERDYRRPRHRQPEYRY